MSNSAIASLSTKLSSIELSHVSLSLPDEVLCHIFGFLDVDLLVQSSRVCSHWYGTLWARLRYLSLDRKAMVDSRVLSQLNEACPELTTLKLSRCVSLRDSCANVVFSMRLLRSLHIHYCDWITDNFFELMTGHSSLTELSVVASCRITLARPSLPPQLKILTLSACRGLDKSLMSNLALLTKLQALDLSDCAALLGLNEGIGNLLLLSGLTELSLRRTGFIDNALQAIGELTQLTSLDLSQNLEITAVGIAHMSKLQKLTWLNLNHCPNISSPSLSTVGSFTGLQHLHMGYTGIYDDGLDELVPMPALQTLFISETTPNHLFLTGLARSSMLHSLSLVNCKFDPEDAYLFGFLPFLHSLDLSSASGITDSIFPHLARLSNLHTLLIGSNYSISSAGVVSLQKLPHLAKLSLEWCQRVTDNIGISLSGFPYLRHLSLRSCKRITDVAIPDLLKLSKLEVLDIKYCTSILKLRQYEKDAQGTRLEVRI